MLRTVLFDLDDTLLDFKKSERIALSDTLRELGLEPTEEILSCYRDINRLQWELLERGEITREQVLWRRFVLLFAEYSITVEAETAKRIYEDRLGSFHYFLPYAEQLLEELHTKYDLYLITNGTSYIQRRRLESAGILPYFRDVFISHEVGYNKPDVRYFEHCFAQIKGFQKEKAVIVGDSLSSDIRGGNAVGVRTCWFNSSHQVNDGSAVPHLEFDSLEQLPHILSQL